MPPGGIPRALAYVLLLSSAPCSTIVFGALGPALPSIAKTFDAGGNGSFIAQMVMAMPGLGTVLGGALAGRLLERFGIRATMICGLAAYMLAGSAGLYVDGAWPLLASRFILGITVATHATCVMVLLSDWTSPDLRARLLGFTSALSGAVSVTVINLSGGLMLYGGWRAPFAIYFLAAIFLLCAVATLRRHRRVAPARAAPVAGSLRPLFPLYGLIFVLFLIVMMAAIQGPLLLADIGIEDPTRLSFMISLSSVGSSTAGFIFGWLIRYVGPRWIMVLSPALVSTGFIVAGSAPDLTLVAAACTLFGFGAGMTYPFVFNLMLSKAPPELRARAVGPVFAIISAASFANPFIIAPLEAAFGIRVTFIIVGATIATGAALNAAYQLSVRRKLRAGHA
jgi:MFS family permease